MKLDTSRNFLLVGWEFHSSSFLVPVRTPEDYVGKILRLSFTAHAELADMKSTVSAYFMPNSPAGSIESASKAVFSSVGAPLQVSVALCTETGFQASKVRPCGSHIGEQDASRVPLDLVVSLTPSEVLVITAPPSDRR
eukprot:14389-Amphidinium_carterae.1